MADGGARGRCRALRGPAVPLLVFFFFFSIKGGPGSNEKIERSFRNYYFLGWTQSSDAFDQSWKKKKKNTVRTDRPTPGTLALVGDSRASLSHVV
eukprot:6697-Prymnesium_polylepis.1